MMTNGFTVHWLTKSLCQEIKMKLILLPWLLSLIVTTSSDIQIRDPAILKVLQSYDRTRVPKADGNNKTNIKIGVLVNDIQLDPKREILQIDAYIQLSWRDTRLEEFYSARKAENRSPIVETAAHALIWTPMIFFRNAQDVHEISTPHSLRMLQVKEHGMVEYSMKLQLDLRCPALGGHKLTAMESTCHLQIESFGNTADEMSLSWQSRPLTLDTSVQVAGYSFTEVNFNKCDQNILSGTLPCIEAQLSFRRDFVSSLFLSGVYMSSFLLVVLSWLGFWVDGPQSHYVRLVLGFAITAILSCYQVGTGLYNLQRIGGHSIDGWLAFCMTLVLATLLEFAFTHVLLRVVPTKTRHACWNGRGEQSQSTDTPLSGDTVEKMSRMIDVACGLVIFPLIFAIYNMFYWSTYMP